LLDKYYYLWREEVDYPHSKFDGFLDFVELDEVFDDKLDYEVFRQYHNNFVKKSK
jgi:hypothetical protein